MAVDLNPGGNYELPREIDCFGKYVDMQFVQRVLATI